MKSDKFENWIADLGNIRLFVTILVSSIFGGFMSLYITTKYGEAILTTFDLGVLFSLLFVGGAYFIIIAIAVILLGILIRAITFYADILWEPFGLFFSWCKKKLQIKMNKEYLKFLDGRLYKQYPRQSNLIISILSIIFILSHKSIFTEPFGTKSIPILIIALTIIGIFNIIMWIKEKKK